MVSWRLLFGDSAALTDGTFKFFTSSGQPSGPDITSSMKPEEQCDLVVVCYPTKQGSFSATFQLVVNGDQSLPYHPITLNANVPSGVISCEPAELAMIPAPLNSPVSAVFILIVQGFVK